MSCYEWESGSVQFSAKEWGKFRKQVLTEWRTRQESCYQHACDLYDKIKKETKGLRGRSRAEKIEQTMNRHFIASAIRKGSDEADDIQRAVLQYDFGRGEYALVKPKFTRKTFGLPVVVSRGRRIGNDGWQMSFNDAERTFSWEVWENNRAVDHAHGNYFVKGVFRRLDRVKWTRNTGGYIVGNNEYNKDDDSPGGGANYVSRSYGPLGERARLSTFRTPMW